MQEIIPFSGNPLDRAAVLRRDDAWLAAQCRAAESRFLPFWRLNVLARVTEQAELCWLGAAVNDYLADGAAPLLLGLRDGIAHFAVDLSNLADPIPSLGIEGAEFADARRIAVDLPEGDAGILAQGRSLIDWHARHRFCGTCGAPTAVGCGGSVRTCTRCGAEHFPGPHPVVIMVVWRGDRCLLGRGRGWAPGRFSALAGFIDHGETIEEAVAREVKEEVGLDVDEVVYHASQPWPFPMSLMIGCFAHATGEDVAVDPEELAEARWFTREEIRRALESPDTVDFGIPGRIAIAHHLIKAWSTRF
ncbi:MAG: NAD(+) diphosphatase [Candidatus Rokubacteria bacterium]|nr:NAD(+) diphosphatase [Candidatus Rokubacteria bacterium]